VSVNDSVDSTLSLAVITIVGIHIVILLSLLSFSAHMRYMTVSPRASAAEAFSNLSRDPVYPISDSPYKTNLGWHGCFWNNSTASDSFRTNQTRGHEFVLKLTLPPVATCRRSRRGQRAPLCEPAGHGACACVFSGVDEKIVCGRSVRVNR
jgi:hypothetical protein